MIKNEIVAAQNVLELIEVLEHAGSESCNMVDIQFFYCNGDSEKNKDALLEALNTSSKICISDVRIKYEEASNGIGCGFKITCNNRYGDVGKHRLETLCLACRRNLFSMSKPGKEMWVVINEMFEKRNLCVKISQLIPCDDNQYAIKVEDFAIIDVVCSKLELITKNKS